jgi:hypothetical protein
MLMGAIKYPWLFGAILAIFSGLIQAQDIIEKGEEQPFFAFDYGTKVLLNDGKVLIIGGSPGTKAQTQTLTQLFDVSRQEFFNSAPLHFYQRYPTAIHLDDNRVLVVGGAFPEKVDASIPSYSAEVWYPETKTWMLLGDIQINTGSLVYANKLDDGNILLVADQRSGLSQSTRADFKQFDAWLWNVKTNLVNHKKIPVGARERAAVAILRDGRVLFIGGYQVAFEPEEHCKDIPIAEVRRQGFETGDWCDSHGLWNGSVKPSTEMWDSENGKVTQLAYQAVANEFAHHAQLLRNGDVLVAVDDKQAARWDASSGSWHIINELINNKGAHVLSPWFELPDDSLLGYKAKYSLIENKWLSTPALTGQADIVGIHEGKVIALASSEPYLRVLNEAQEIWSPVLKHDYVRTTDNLTLSLHDGRLLVVGFMPKGTSKDGEGRQMLHQLWNPKSDQWEQQASDEPELQHAQLAQLPSGDVLRVGLLAEGVLECRRWSIQADVWTGCDRLTLTPAEPDRHISYQDETQRPARFQFALGAIEGSLDSQGCGAVMLVESVGKAQLFNEQMNSWMSVDIESHEQKLVHGYRIHLPDALYSLRDKSTQKITDVSSLVVRFRQADPMDTLNADMLWDSARHYWAYLFTQTRFSRSAELLPDGCAIAYDGMQFKLLDPTAETITNLLGVNPDIKTGIMTVLSDGTVTLAGSPRNGDFNDRSKSFFARKASCRGFENTQALATSVSSISAAANNIPVEASSVLTTKPSFISRLWDWLKDHKGLVPAILVPLVLYFLLRLILRKSKRYDQEIKVSSNTGFVVRIIIYGGLGLLLGPLLFSTLFSTLSQLFNDDGVKTAKSEIPWYQQNKPQTLPADLSIPCRFVGFWKVKNKNSGSEPQFLYSMYDDGHLQVQAMLNGTTKEILYEGKWAYRDKELIWMSNAKGAQLQTDRVINYSSSFFTLQQADGQFIEFLHSANPGQHDCVPGTFR